MSERLESRLEVLVDITRTLQARGRMVGTVRVESECASALLREHRDHVVPIAWSAARERFIELDRTVATEYLAAGVESLPPADGPPLEQTRRPDPSCRRIVLVTGAGWLSNLKLLHGLFHLRHALGAELHVVVHDLIHLLFPQWAPKEEAQSCASAHQAMLAGADRLLVYSDATARDIAEVSLQRGIPTRDVRRVLLGTIPARRDGAPGSPRAFESLADRPYVLYVSSIAARKNHLFIAEVWKRLVRELGTRLPRLLFAGAVAADQESMMERLGRDPVLTEHLVHISGATDEHLAWLYRHCLFTVFPSLYEGWGLPVAESLAHRKVCVASNASAIPEVTAGCAPLLDPLDVRAWCDVVRTLVLDSRALASAERRLANEYRPVTWGAAAERLWEVMMPALGAARAPALVGTSAAAAPLCTLGATHGSWQPVRSALGVVMAHTMRIGVPLADLPGHGIRLDLTLRSAESTRVRVETEINGAVCDACLLDPGASATRRFDLPRELLLTRGVLDISVTARPLHRAPALLPPAVSLESAAWCAMTSEHEAAAIAAQREIWRVEDMLHFNAGSRALALLRDGWGEATRWGVWSTKPEAVLSFRPMPHVSESLVLRATVRGFVPPPQPALAVDVLANGRRLATWSFRHPGDFSFVERKVVIPPELLVNGAVLTFAIPGARSPRELGMSLDERRLGLGLVRAVCTTAGGPAG